MHGTFFEPQCGLHAGDDTELYVIFSGCIVLAVLTCFTANCMLSYLLASAGAWQLSEALQLQWSEGDQWTAVAELPAGRILEYKYVLVDSSNSQGLSWQQGNNSVLALRQDDREVCVSLLWQHCAGKVP